MLSQEDDEPGSKHSSVDCFIMAALLDDWYDDNAVMECILDYFWPRRNSRGDNSSVGYNQDLRSIKMAG